MPRSTAASQRVESIAVGALTAKYARMENDEPKDAIRPMHMRPSCFLSAGKALICVRAIVRTIPVISKEKGPSAQPKVVFIRSGCTMKKPETPNCARKFVQTSRYTHAMWRVHSPSHVDIHEVADEASAGE